MPINMTTIYSQKKFLRQFDPQEANPGNVHSIKCWTEYFDAIVAGQKTFEIRKNDRDYKVLDFLMIYEWNADKKEYTGRMITAEITYITDFQQKDEYVVIGLGKIVTCPALPEGHPLHPKSK